MSGRRRYLVAYDIRNVGRLRKVHNVVKSFGLSMQYSVFLCDLDKIELIKLREALLETLRQGIDTVAIVDLGQVGASSERFEFLGSTPKLPHGGPTIV